MGLSVGGVTQFLTLKLKEIFNIAIKIFDIQPAPFFNTESQTKAAINVEESYDFDTDILNTKWWQAIAKILGLPLPAEPEVDEDTTINIAMFFKDDLEIGLIPQDTGSPYPVLHNGRRKQSSKDRGADARDGGKKRK